MEFDIVDLDIARDYERGCEDTRKELRDILRANAGLGASSRLAIIITWLGRDLEEMLQLTDGRCRCGHGTKMHTCRARRGGCAWCGCGKE